MEQPADKSILFNTGLRWAGELVNKAVWFVFIIVLARKLGVAGFGYFNYAFSFAGLLVIFTDLGTNIFLVRESARDNTRAGYYLTNVLGLKCAVSVVVLAVAFLIPKESPQIAFAVMLFSTALVLSSFLDPFNAVYRAHKHMYKETIVMLLWRFLLVGFSGGGLYILHTGLNGVAVAFILASAAAVFVTVMVTFKTYGSIVKSRYIDLANWGALLKGSFFLGALLIIGGIFFKGNVILLQYLGEVQEVGWYGAAFKLIEGTFFVPSIFIGSLFPVLCEHNQNSAISRAGMALFKKAFLFLLGISALIASLVTVFAEPIIRSLYGQEYLPAASVVKILAWALVFIYVNELCTFLFLSINRQKSIFKVMAMGLMTYALLCVILIPSYGYAGAAWVLFLTQAVVTVLNLLLLKRPQ